MFCFVHAHMNVNYLVGKYQFYSCPRQAMRQCVRRRPLVRLRVWSNNRPARWQKFSKHFCYFAFTKPITFLFRFWFGFWHYFNFEWCEVRERTRKCIRKTLECKLSETPFVINSWKQNNDHVNAFLFEIQNHIFSRTIK